ncbi:MAG: helix-turn-helix domain-containing protein [Treponema sp.]|nr:helix-turn-helix domain-containing protein [Treponema sp.]
MELLDRVKELCRLKGISQGRMEKEIGISNGASSKWKTSSPSLDILKKLSEYFGVSVDYLMTGKEKEGGETYYINEETREIAQEIFEKKELRMLFDVTRKSTPQRLMAYYNMIKELESQEHGEE